MDALTNEQQVVIFRLAASSYAIDIAAVREIIRFQPITAVPQAPEHIVGVINLRSSVVPVLDLHQRCGLPAAAQTRDTRIVVAQVDAQSVGLIVDAVSEVTTLPAGVVEPVEGVVRGEATRRLLRGVARREERLVLLLDLTRITALDDAALNRADATAA